jgi:hypothetical protein
MINRKAACCQRLLVPAAKPTQTVSMSVRSALMVLDIKSVVSMSNKNMWWLRLEENIV